MCVSSFASLFLSMLYLFYLFVCFSVPVKYPCLRLLACVAVCVYAWLLACLPVCLCLSVYACLFGLLCLPVCVCVCLVYCLCMYVRVFV